MTSLFWGIHLWRNMNLIETVHVLCRPCAFNINLEITEDKLECVIAYVTHFDMCFILLDITHSSERFYKRASIRIQGYFPSTGQCCYPMVIHNTTKVLLKNSLILLWSVAVIHGISVLNLVSYFFSSLRKQSWIIVQMNQAVFIGGIFFSPIFFL